MIAQAQPKAPDFGALAEDYNLCEIALEQLQRLRLPQDERAAVERELLAKMDMIWRALTAETWVHA